MAKNEKSLSWEKARKIFRELGIKEASPDHPVYTEPTSIRFLNHATDNAAKRTQDVAPEKGDEEWMSSRR